MRVLYDVLPLSLIGGAEADADVDAGDTGDACACWRLNGAIVDEGLDRAESRTCCIGELSETLVALQLFATGTAGDEAAHCQHRLHLMTG